MAKHNAYLKDENVLTLFSLNNLIVPEIQREYVWGNNDDVIRSFLVELESKAAPCPTCHNVHTAKNINMGFLYSYKPPYVKYESERILDEFLIDGQQRITTLFLLIFYRATVEGRLDDFMAICRADNDGFEMGFNYKVRSLTQEFLIRLVEYARLKGSHAFDFVGNPDDAPHWFLDDYRSDPTISAMVRALCVIKEVFSSQENKYFDYLLINVRFWHFKTEATSQGEELYITMNSRGRQLSGNEMQKSRTLKGADQIEYGTRWELWQTFFWRNRKSGGVANPNADKGFNNFLACIDGYLQFHGHRATSIVDVERYVNALMYVCSRELRSCLEQTYNGLFTGWYDGFVHDLWNEINGYGGDWSVIDPRGGDEAMRVRYRNASVARNKSMLFWPWMNFFEKCDDEVDAGLLLRLLHFYYIRYKCFKRSATSISTIVDVFFRTRGKIHDYQTASGVDDEEEDNVNSRIFSDEELLLSSFCFSGCATPEVMEAAVWEVQNLPYFIDGKDVGGNTVYESFGDADIICCDALLESITAFRENIVKLLGYDVGRTSHVDIKRILLFYKVGNTPFWIRQSPWYYFNYETSSWKRIVRSPHFITFFKEYVNTGLDPADFLEAKRREHFAQPANAVIRRDGAPVSHRKLAILYDLLSADNSLWDTEHENIAFYPNRNPEAADDIFPGQDTLWKARRYCDRNARIALAPDWQQQLSKYGVTTVAPDGGCEISALESDGVSSAQ